MECRTKSARVKGQFGRARPTAGHRIGFRTMRILIADDDATLRHGLRVQLERWGYEPVVCEDGTKAREVLNSPDPPPLVILDWSMPGDDGVTLCGEIRTNPDLRSLYFILLTAHDTRDEMVAGLAGGADEYDHQAVRLACPARADPDGRPDRRASAKPGAARGRVAAGPGHRQAAVGPSADLLGPQADS